MKNYLLLSSLLFANVCFAQFTDDFADGDFTANPNWAGSSSRFVVFGNQLRLQAPAVADVAYLSTVSQAIENASWEFLVKLDFNPSSGNYARIYLASDQSDLTGALNGYFVLVGDTPDEISLYRQTGTTRTKIIDGVDGRTNLAVVNVKIKVTRDVNGVWSLFSDVGPTNSHQSEGSVTDVTHAASSYAGVFCSYTATRNSHFYFDNFLVTGTPGTDTTAPTFQSVEANSSTEVTLTFSEALHIASAEAPSNYVIDGAPGTPVSATLLADQKSVKLTFATPFENGVLNSLAFSGINDLALNSTSGNLSFRYFVPIPAAFNDIVINELFPDPSPQIGLPSSEFLELYNRSNKPFDLAGWKIKDLTTAGLLPSAFLLPGEYLILCSAGSTTDYTSMGSTLGVSNFPTLNNSSDAFTLIDPSGQKIDSVNYVSSWFQDEDKAQGGYTLERLDPQVDSNEPTNWRASTDAFGGTPGEQNSVFGENPDIIFPAVVVLEVISSKQLKVTFSEALSNFPTEDETNYSINNGAHPIESILNGSELTLHFSADFVNGQGDTLLIKSFSDLAGNTVNNTKLGFRFFVPTPAKFNDIVINELFADPTPKIGLPETEFIELYNASSAPFDLTGWKVKDQNSLVTLPQVFLLPGHFLIVCSKSAVADYSSLGETLGLTNFPTLNNSGESLALIDPNGVKIDSVNYAIGWYQNDEKAQGGYTLERLNPRVDSNEPTNWRASVDESGGTPGRQNSVFGKSPDVVAPAILFLEVVSAQQLKLTFSEPLVIALASDEANYSIDNGVHPTESSTSGAEVILHFSDPFVNGKSDTLIIQSFADLAGNTVNATKISFRYFVSTQATPRCIILNEIMADPTPIVQLPEAEYIELVNISASPFDLQGWELSDGTTTTTLSSFVLLPGEFLILTSPASKSKFAEFGSVLGVVNFPSLNNSGEALVIRDSSKQKIDSLSYALAWYQNDEKKEGGFSLERLRYDFSSTDETNWRASDSSAGGTPGAVNSVFGKNPDTKAPELVRMDVLTNHELTLVFNEALSPASAANLSNFLVDQGLGNPASSAFAGTGSSITLYFNQPFVDGINYTLSVQNLQDLAGNTTTAFEKHFVFFINKPASKKDIIFTEIMADPTPVQGLPEAEYVEVFNRSPHPFDLKGWLLTDGNTTAQLPTQIILPNSYLILTATSQASKLASLGNVMPVPNFPTLSNEGERLRLKTPEGLTIDSVNFTTEWYRNTEKAEGGWSLELIDIANTCGEEDNWVASEHESGGSPGTVNSVIANKPDLNGPKLLSALTSSEKELLVQFNEKLSSALDVKHFNITPTQPVASARFTDSSLREVSITIKDGLLPRTLYQIVADVSDCAGNAVNTDFNNLTFALTEEPDSMDVVINEILFNPLPGQSDYVEIYNRSEKFFDLKGWTLGKPEDGAVADRKQLTTDHLLMSPGSFIVFTPLRDQLAISHPQAPLDRIVETALPSLPDDEGGIVLQDSNGASIDAFHYQSQMHSPIVKDEEGVSLERIAYELPTNDSNNWTSATSTSGFGTPGEPNSNLRSAETMAESQVRITPEIFSPGQSFTQIQYQFEQPGQIANIRILDIQGHEIKEIANNTTLSVSGFFRWDGDRGDATVASSGYYVVWFELFDVSGNVRTFRKRVVVANR